MSHSIVLYHETAPAQINTSNYFASNYLTGFIIDVPTTFSWNTDDSSEETRCGKGATHITGGIIILRKQSATTEL